MSVKVVFNGSTPTTIEYKDIPDGFFRAQRGISGDPNALYLKTGLGLIYFSPFPSPVIPPDNVIFRNYQAAREAKLEITL